MIKNKIKYKFDGIVWKYPGQTGWYFVSLPKDISVEIRNALKFEEEGWGRLKVTVNIGSTEWQTSIWFDTKLGIYLLPIKAEIRKKEKIIPGDLINIILFV